ncbi:hypothetical protein MTO96_000163 [Rhipicephalus appendiculatus]
MDFNDCDNECIEDDNRAPMQLQLGQTPTASPENYGLDSEGFRPREDAPSGEPGSFGAGGFLLERPDEGDIGNDEPEEEPDGFRGDDVSLEIATERLSSMVHRTVEKMAEDLREIFQKIEESIHRMNELRDAVLQHEQEQMQKLENAKTILLGVFENSAQ